MLPRDDTATTSHARESRAERQPATEQEDVRLAAHPMKGGESMGRRLREQLDGVGEESQDIEHDEQGE